MGRLTLERQPWWPDRPWSLWRLFAYAIVMPASAVGLVYILTTLKYLYFPAAGEFSKDMMLPVVSVWSMVIVFAVAHNRTQELVDFIGLRDLSRLASKWKTSVAVAAATWAVAVLVCLACIWIVNLAGVEWPEHSRVTDPIGWRISLFDVVVTGPISEEILFRGVILCVLASRWRPGAAIVASALAFWMWHIVWDVSTVSDAIGVMVTLFADIHTLFMALALGWYQLRVGSLYVPIGIHALMNLGIALFYPVG